MLNLYSITFRTPLKELFEFMSLGIKDKTTIQENT